jgi:hypothetical protein
MQIHFLQFRPIKLVYNLSEIIHKLKLNRSFILIVFIKYLLNELNLNGNFINTFI